MTPYAGLVFLHVLGAVGMFAAWTIEALGLLQLAQAGTADALQSWLALRRRAAKLGGISMLAAVLTGVIMMVMRGAEPWMRAAIAELILIVAVAVAVERRIAPRLAAATTGPGSGSRVDMAIISSAMAASLRFRIVTGVTILALMTLRPGTTGALALIAAGIAIGFAAASRSASRRAPTATT